MSGDLIGAFDELPNPVWRRFGEDTVRLGKARNHVPVLLEVDVTAARAALAERRQRGGSDVSFTAWAVKCIAQAAAEQRRVHAVRRGRRDRPVAFYDVDVCLAVYRRIAGDESGERLPMPFIVRNVNEKPLERVSDEIRTVQSRPLPPDQQWLDPLADVPPPWLVRLGLAAPRRLRDWLYWDRLLGDPFRVKKTMGTVTVTSVPLTSKSGGAAWGIPAGIHPLIVALGAIGRRPGIVEDRVEARDMLSLTVLFDHDVVDGVPMALYLRRITDLLEGAFGL
jgi:pyruvate/2-oxoglutarate dehydrogenase complex dihydrolipoamide acyltransferase (E2) component